MALEGNKSAMRLVLDRACGRPSQAQPDGVELDINIPSLRTVAGCKQATDTLAAAVCEGAVNPDLARVLLEIVQTRMKAIEVEDLEQRLADLEKTASDATENRETCGE